MNTPAFILKESPARCSEEPNAPIAKFNRPGFSLATVTSSATFLTGSEGCATSTDGDDETMVRGVKSLMGSKGSEG